MKYDDVLSLVASNELESSIDEAKLFLKDVYGLNIVIGPDPSLPNITGEIPNKYEQTRGLTLILHEAGKYPPNFFRRNSLPGINLLNRVKVNGLDYYGGYATSDGKFGLAYDAEIFEKNREYFRGVFHHELYHVLDYKDGVDKDNAAWREIHNCGCQAYLEIGGRDNLPSNNPQQKQLTADWFLTDYSRRNPVEDRAVMAQNLFIPSEHRRLQQRIASMQDLQLKDIWQKKYRWILDNYQKWSNDTMNEAYWGDLLKDKVNLSYFAR